MKTKLLKKVRKRYKITYYPKGTFIFYEYVNKKLMLLSDNKEEHHGVWVEINPDRVNCNDQSVKRTKEHAKIYLLQCLSSWIRNDYKHTSNKKKIQIKKVWY